MTKRHSELQASVTKYQEHKMANKRGRRPGFRMTEHHRSKIANSKILSFLVETALGNREMTKTQAFVAMGLIRKTLPDLSTTVLQGDAENPLQTRTTVAWERVDAKLIESDETDETDETE